MKRSEAIFGLLRIATDAMAVVGALSAAYWLRARSIDLLPFLQLPPAESLPPFAYFLRNFGLPFAALFVAIAATLHLYVIRITLPKWIEVGRIVIATLVWVALIVGWFAIGRKQLFFSRALLLHATVLCAVAAVGGRLILRGVQRSLLAAGIGVRRVLAVGTEPLPRSLEHVLRRDLRYRFLGQVRTLHSVHAEEARSHIDLLLQTDPGTGSEETAALIDTCRSHHIDYAFLPPVLLSVPHLLSVARVGGVPVLQFHPTPLDGWGAVIKRVFDVVVAAIFLVLLSPLLVLIAVAIRTDSSGPAIFVSWRVGRRGTRTIPILKFRSMVENAEDQKFDLAHLSHRHGGPLFKVRNDPRVTRVGRLLRRFSLDELPQLLNVLVGHLSLVGPRPHLPEEVAQYSSYQRRVFAVKPGVTGLAQISGRSDLPFGEEVTLDLRYIEEWSLLLDLTILLKTIGVVIRGRGAD